MRASGILMHVTSLPGPNGIGAMGKPAHRFVDFLEQAGQKYWQVLPLSPTGYGDSPYQSFSAFAGNHYLIDLELLVDEGLLRREEVEAVSWSGQEDRVDYGILYENRGPVLYKAYERFLGMPNRAFHQFIQRQQDWLQDYALFMALKEEFQGKPWQEWPDGLRLRQPEEMAAYREKLKYKIAFQYFLQFKFFEQWDRLHRYAKSKGVRIIGDVPIYVPLDSADVWSNCQLFQLDEDRKPRLVAGGPPDAFTADGQLWGDPTREVRKLQKDSGYPGMKVLEFAFDSREPSDYLPHRYTRDCVCYTGTHDNAPLGQWLEEAKPEDVAYAKGYLGLSQEEGQIWGVIRGGMGSVSDLFIAQMQDYLELGAEARMNFPGTLSNNNWTWRAQDGMITDALAHRIRELTRLFDRI